MLKDNAFEFISPFALNFDARGAPSKSTIITVRPHHAFCTVPRDLDTVPY